MSTHFNPIIVPTSVHGNTTSSEETPWMTLKPWQKDRIAFIMNTLSLEWYTALQRADVSRHCGKETESLHPLTFLQFVLTTPEHEILAEPSPDSEKNVLEAHKQTVSIHECIQKLYAKRDGFFNCGKMMWNSFLHGENGSGGIVEKIKGSDVKALLDPLAREINVAPKHVEGLAGTTQKIEETITLLFGKIAGAVELEPFPIN